MKNIFNNLLFNHRFVFQLANAEGAKTEAKQTEGAKTEARPETPEEKQTRVQNEEFDKLVKEAPGKSNKQLGDKFGEYKDAKKEEGGNKVHEVKLHGEAIRALANVLTGKGGKKFTKREKDAAIKQYMREWRGEKPNAKEIKQKEPTALDKKFAQLELDAKNNPFLKTKLEEYKAKNTKPELAYKTPEQEVPKTSGISQITDTVEDIYPNEGDKLIAAAKAAEQTARQPETMEAEYTKAYESASTLLKTYESALNKLGENGEEIIKNFQDKVTALTQKGDFIGAKRLSNIVSTYMESIKTALENRNTAHATRAALGLVNLVMQTT